MKAAPQTKVNGVLLGLRDVQLLINKIVKGLLKEEGPREVDS